MLLLGTVAECDTVIKILIDGEGEATTKAYPRLSSYTNVAIGDRVVIANINGSYVILGKVVSTVG